jgi:hypothetical protein
MVTVAVYELMFSGCSIYTALTLSASVDPVLTWSRSLVQMHGDPAAADML